MIKFLDELEALITVSVQYFWAVQQPYVFLGKKVCIYVFGKKEM